MEQNFKFNLGDTVKVREVCYHDETGDTYSGNYRIAFRFYNGYKNIYIIEVMEGISISIAECDLELVTPYVPQDIPENKRLLDIETYNALMRLGILDTSVRAYNRGKSNYSKHIIQPWSIWIDYDLNAFDADIVKRVLREKEDDPRRLDYEKIIHICEERIRQIDCEENV